MSINLFVGVHNNAIIFTELVIISNLNYSKEVMLFHSPYSVQKSKFSRSMLFHDIFPSLIYFCINYFILTVFYKSDYFNLLGITESQIVTLFLLSNRQLPDAFLFITGKWLIEFRVIESWIFAV